MFGAIGLFGHVSMSLSSLMGFASPNRTQCRPDPKLRDTAQVVGDLAGRLSRAHNDAAGCCGGVR